MKNKTLVNAGKMDGHRKLLVLAVNELLRQNLITLDGDKERGYIITKIAGQNAAIIWRDIGYKELSITIWWQYNECAHKSGVTYSTYLPYTKKCLSVGVSGWLERESGKYIMGHGAEHMHSKYTRRGIQNMLDAIPEPKPAGYAAEGKFRF